MMMKKIPEINRARGYYVYTANGKRYLDMALEGGRLVMGHRQKGYALAMKNAIDKGILPGYPSPYAHRLKQAVCKLLGHNCFVYLFSSEERAREAIGALNAPDLINDPINPLEILILPVPFAFAPGVVVSDTELPLEDELVSPVILAGAVRAVYNLIAFKKEADYSGWEKVGLLKVCSDKWRVEMPYLYPLCEPDKYAAVWEAFFEAGIILSLDYDKPSVLPPYDELSDGSRKKLLKLLSEC
jgi:hypothetical protein